MTHYANTQCIGLTHCIRARHSMCDAITQHTRRCSMKNSDKVMVLRFRFINARDIEKWREHIIEYTGDALDVDVCDAVDVGLWCEVDANDEDECVLRDMHDLL